MKNILWKDPLTHTNALHNGTNILQVKDLYSLYIALFVTDSLYKNKTSIFHKYHDSQILVHKQGVINNLLN